MVNHRHIAKEVMWSKLAAHIRNGFSSPGLITRVVQDMADIDGIALLSTYAEPEEFYNYYTNNPMRRAELFAYLTAKDLWPASICTDDREALIYEACQIRGTSVEDWYKWFVRSYGGSSTVPVMCVDKTKLWQHAHLRAATYPVPLKSEQDVRDVFASASLMEPSFSEFKIEAYSSYHALKREGWFSTDNVRLIQLFLAMGLILRPKEWCDDRNEPLPEHLKKVKSVDSSKVDGVKMAYLWAVEYGTLITALIPAISTIKSYLKDSVPGAILASWTADANGAQKIYDYVNSHTFDPNFEQAFRRGLIASKIHWLLVGGGSKTVEAAPFKSELQKVVNDDVVDLEMEKESMPRYLVGVLDHSDIKIQKTRTPIEDEKTGQRYLQATINKTNNKCGLYTLATGVEKSSSTADLETHADVIGLSDDEDPKPKTPAQVRVKNAVDESTPKITTVKIGGVERKIRVGGGLPQYLVVCQNQSGSCSAAVPDEPFKSYNEACELLKVLAVDSKHEEFAVYVLCSSNKIKEIDVNLVSHAKVVTSKK